jgi:hypothetical protein
MRDGRAAPINCSATARLGLCYRGREAPPELLELLRNMATQLGELGIDELRAAAEE